MHAAAFVGNLPVCKQLIAAGADPNLKNQEGLSPVEIAVRYRHNIVSDYLKNCCNRIVSKWYRVKEKEEEEISSFIPIQWEEKKPIFSAFIGRFFFGNFEEKVFCNVFLKINSKHESGTVNGVQY